MEDNYGKFLQILPNAEYVSKVTIHSVDHEWCTHPDCMDPIMELLGESLRMNEEDLTKKSKE